MSDEKDPQKAALIKAVLASIDDATALSRMKTLGFWPAHEPVPSDPPGEIVERAQLDAELATLVKIAGDGEKPEKALQRERIRRWKESRERRKAKKAERVAEAKQRAEAWRAQRAQRLVYAGLGVSAGLQDVESDVAALEAGGLPIWRDARDVASTLGISIAKLRWLTFHRRGATLVHYHRYGIPKKTGGIRAISAPKPALADAQQKVQSLVLQRIAPSDEAHGFVRERSVVSNARPHVGRAVVVNLDLRDFFPTISFRRVKGLFAKLGYSEQVATVLALLCTEPPRVPAELDGQRYHVALGARVLPQGACTSPAITNLICRRLDARLRGIARALGFTYTRYADDLTFSGDDPAKLASLFGMVRKVIATEGFAEHEGKTRVMRRASRQEVTGVVVNRAVRLPRDEKRALRALLYNCARFGMESQNRDGRPSFASYLRGRVAWAVMVEPALGPRLFPALERALAGRRSDL
ncbi:reverse transcriptase family protein [Sandaracinus amylolyticus]|uniref:reverse transcriptase family protein n=1 Tax=Sandaracinus amylolyticus TaxID=927083 RepID=UPI001F1C01B1|nr:reverse transcriptase family protein [Sandaracinus amylolyticus]UJR80646.1 Retron-type RNA-directed DNA polymerase [Sandaracinus amylolyticus]